MRALLLALVALAASCSVNVFTCSDASGPTDLAPPADLVPELVLGVEVYGQSLGTGYGGAPALTVRQSARHLMFKGGIDRPADLSALVPLAESGVETGWAAGAELLGDAVGRTVLVAGAAVPSTRLVDRMPGTPAYQRLVDQVTAARDLVAARGGRYELAAVWEVGGEADFGGWAYGQNLEALQPQIEADVRVLTGQAAPVLLFVSQTSAQAGWSFADANAGMLDAAAALPGRIVVVCEKGAEPYSDAVHLTGAGYRHLGELYGDRTAQALAGSWAPLAPLRVEPQKGGGILVTFHVPVPPLGWDVGQPDPGSRGFALVDGPQSEDVVPIRSVSLVGPDAVLLEPARPLGPGTRVRYAHAVPHGQLVDADARLSLSGGAQVSRALRFNRPVPPVTP